MPTCPSCTLHTALSSNIQTYSYLLWLFHSVSLCLCLLSSLQLADIDSLLCCLPSPPPSTCLPFPFPHTALHTTLLHALLVHPLPFRWAGRIQVGDDFLLLYHHHTRMHLCLAIVQHILHIFLAFFPLPYMVFFLSYGPLTWNTLFVRPHMVGTVLPPCRYETYHYTVGSAFEKRQACMHFLLFLPFKTKPVTLGAFSPLLLLLPSPSFLPWWWWWVDFSLPDGTPPFGIPKLLRPWA